jgi:Na+/H+ antiporter NhaD/arsenite permease-like protein
VPNEQPKQSSEAVVQLKPGALVICGMFLLTIATAVSFKQVLHLPPFMGMMVGLSALMFYGYWLKITYTVEGGNGGFDIFNKVRHAEWDTLLFFFGVVFAVGGYHGKYHGRSDLCDC